jgi:hypothetical protein
VTGNALKVAATATFARHETFHPRYGWIHKGFAAASANPKIFLEPDATVKLGVGKNMVSAIRFWSAAFKVLREVPSPDRPRVSISKPTAFGRALLSEEGWDPYLEDPGSVWLLHWRLLEPTSMVPAWWVAFNAFAPLQFDEAQLTAHIGDLCAAAGWPAVVHASIKKDADCMLRMYTARRHGRQGLDDVLDCPFRELGLIESVPGESRTWRFNVGDKQNLPDAIVVYACLDFAARVAPGASSMTVARLTADPGSPGAVFKLTESALYETLRRAAEASDAVTVAEPGGLRQLIFNSPAAEAAPGILEAYFRSATGSSMLLDRDDEDVREELVLDAKTAKRVAELDARIEAASPVKRVQLIQKRLELVKAGAQ